MTSIIRAFGCSAANLVLSAAVLAAEPPAPKWKVEAQDRQNIEARITYEVYTTTYTVDRWIAYMPEPPELAAQTNIKVTSTPKSKVVSERSSLARKIRHFDIAMPNPTPASKLELEWIAQATLRRRKLVPLEDGEAPPKVAALTQTEAKYYTLSGREIDFKAKAFKAWLEKKELRLKKGEQPIDFAERVLAVIRSDYVYGFELGEKKSSVCCDTRTNDCAGLSFIFVAAMRANDIPTRLLVGRLAKPRRMGSKPGEEEHDQAHVRAEFYLADVGWIAVDPSNANVYKSRKVRDFIGEDPGDMLVLHVDLDLKLPYPDNVQTAQCLQLTPGYWAHGKGRFDGKFGESGWDVTTAPVNKD
jgi:transglutaminase-like putative cysteine protease